MRTTFRQADVITDRFGSIVGITRGAWRPRVDDENETEPWQWLGLTLNVDCRYAADSPGMADDGLIRLAATTWSNRHADIRYYNGQST